MLQGNCSRGTRRRVLLWSRYACEQCFPLPSNPGFSFFLSGCVSVYWQVHCTQCIITCDRENGAVCYCGILTRLFVQQPEGARCARLSSSLLSATVVSLLPVMWGGFHFGWERSLYHDVTCRNVIETRYPCSLSPLPFTVVSVCPAGSFGLF